MQKVRHDGESPGLGALAWGAVLVAATIGGAIGAGFVWAPTTVAFSAELEPEAILSRDDHARPEDATDLRALLHAAEADDLETARAAVALIAARGCARGRRLSDLLEAAIADQPAGG